jgi:hypothetical protein
MCGIWGIVKEDSMVRRFRQLFILTVLVCTVSSSLAFAQAPQTDQVEDPTLPEFGGELAAVLANAEALKESLTPEQSQATQEIMQRYASEFTALAAQLPSPRAALPDPKASNYRTYLPAVAVNGSLAGAEASAAPAGMTVSLQQIQSQLAILKQIETVQNKVDAEIAAVLSEEQSSLLQQGRTAIRTLTQPRASTGTTASSGNTPSLQASASCYYAAQYASINSTYAKYAYDYAYYNYVYNANGSYGGMYFLYYGWLYALYGHRDVSAGYFDLITIGSDFNGYVADGLTNNYNSYLYSYRGTAYAGQNYNSYGYSAAYLAWINGYNAFQYAYGAYAYNASC